ncbi:YhgE/Pip family protein [Cohnella sp. GCM10012308]|uniref:YhgE/Pip family protein n=1 Tax=Cohnella sp. GCM10012308 TaxID=3317329 RepID=UPI0036137769
MGKIKAAGGVIAGEFKRLTGSKMAMISILGLALIPLMYSGMLIGAFWDPYGKLDAMPVAVVNEDRGAELNGEKLTVGSDLVGELKGSTAFKWVFTDEKDAMDGLADHRYSLAFVVPADFSAKTATLQDEAPQQANVQYYVDDGWNYLTSRIGESAAEKLKTDVGREVTKAYAKATLESVGQAASGFGDAAEGAQQLADGAKDAAGGVKTLHDNLAKLADGTIKLQQGFGKLAGGAASLESGASALASGSAELDGGLKQLAAAQGKLAAGASQADSAAGKLAAGAGKLADSSAKLASGAGQAEKGAAQVADGAGQLADGLKQYAAAHPDDEALQQLVAASQRVADGATQAQQGAASAAAGAEQLSAGQRQLVEGANQLQAGTAALSKGLGQFGAKLGAAESGAASLTDGAGKLAAGAGTLASGIESAGSGAGTVKSGATQLADGSASLEDGLQKLESGSSELGAKLQDASAEAGGVKSGDDQAAMFADPVAVSEHKLTDVPNYGTGMAPYFLALGLYVGVLMSTVILPLRDAAGKVKNGWTWYASKLLLFAPVVLLQVALADTVLIYGIGLKVPNVAAFYGISAVIALTYMTIVQFLVSLADTVGRFVAVVLLTLQLAASEGTYPKELLPHWLQAIGEWMPMTHAIEALRLALAGRSASLIGEQLLDLAAFAAVFVALTLGLFALRSRKIRPAQAELGTLQA